MTEGRSRGGLVAVVVLAALALLALFLGHDALSGLARESAKRTAAAVPVAGEVAGRVRFADGSPAAGARIAIRWRDAAGRAGRTPALADAAGVFSQGNVPRDVAVTEVTASVGPLAATATEPPRAQGPVPGVRAVLTLPATFRIAGSVCSARDRGPVRGAALEAGGVRAVSGDAGEFALEGIPASVLRETPAVVSVAADGFVPLRWPLPKDALPETYGDVTIPLEPQR